MTNQIADYDNPWKEAIAIYFKSFIAFFFPDIYETIDWRINYEFLDTQLQQVMRDDDIGLREADKLVKVWLMDGSETWVLIHLEVQSQYQSNFAERMYVYNSRIFGLYRKRVASLAILADEEKSWRPQEYGYEIWGCRVLLRFPVVKLLDYINEWETLEKSPNPFAAIVMAHLKTQATRQKPQERREWKASIVKTLYQRGYNRAEVRELFRLIDWMMTLPKNLETEFRQEINSYEETNKMRYVTSIERLAREEGMIEKGREDIIDVLQIRFQDLPGELVQEINQIEDVEQLKTLHRQAVTIGSLAEFQQAIDRLKS
ncbi:transposase [Argonema galeatum]|uniref:transposase n=1 Tax=Argonema galeatum TaxID=2942762 RepID=UPI0020126C40|nr:transposase [Argonema galeatum]MCL1468500.1 transposase [Argonema galeatum A003/A1]